MVQVVALHGDEVVGTVEVGAPVVVAVAGGGVGCHAFQIVV